MNMLAGFIIASAWACIATMLLSYLLLDWVAANKSVLKYLLESLLSDKKINKTEMKVMLKGFADKSILSQKDADEMTDFVRDL